MKALLPFETEVAFGIVKPRFCMDYGEELFWQEQLNGNKVSNNSNLGAMHESGIELYRNFEAGPVSLPVYFYLVNGTGSNFGDNNRHPMMVLHIEPEYSGVKLFGSFAYGKYDASDANDVTRYTGGFEYALGDFSIRSEYIAGKWANKLTGTQAGDAVAFGYYAKVFYRVLPWLKVMVDCSLADQNTSSTNSGEKYTTISPVLIIRASDSSLLFLQYDIADWRYKDDSDRLAFKRMTVGWRNTF